jgi:hypothetical protein
MISYLSSDLFRTYSRTWLDKLIYYYSHDWRYFFLAKAASEFDVIMKRLKLKGIITNAGKTAIDSLYRLTICIA